MKKMGTVCLTHFQNFRKKILFYLLTFPILFSQLFLIFIPHVLAVAPDNYKWVTHTAGITGAGSVNAVAVDPTNGNTVYAATGTGGVYKTTNGGTSWSAVNSGFPSGYDITNLTIDPNNHLTLYAVNNGKIYRTTDGGSNWTLSSSGTTVYSYNGNSTSDLIKGVIVDPTNSNHLFSATIASGYWGGVFESTNGGTTWTQVAGTSPSGWIGGIDKWMNDAWPLAIDPSDTNYLYVSSVHETNFRSTNGGVTWKSMTFPSPYSSYGGYAVAVHPTNHQAFIGTWVGMITSTDYGVSWTGIADLSGEKIYGIQFAPSDSTIVYAVTYDGKVYKSTNSGSNWSLMSNNSSISFPSWAFVIGISQTNPNLLYLAAGGNGVYKSTDGGQTLTAVNSGLPLTVSSRYFGIAQSKSNPDIIFYSVISAGLFKSIDGGYTWSLVNSSVIPNIVTVDPTDPNILLANDNTSPGLDLIRSSDGGVSWTTVLTDIYYPLDIQFAPSNHNVVFTHGNSTTAAGLYKSTDNGITWSSISFFANKGMIRQGLSIDPLDENIVYVATYTTGGPYKSTDGGQNWTAINTGIPTNRRDGYSISVSPHDGNLVFYGNWCCELYYRSTDAGANWSQVLDLASLGQYNAAKVLFDLSDVNIVYAGGDYQRLYKSTDGGITWTQFSATGLTYNYPYYSRTSLKRSGELIGTDYAKNFVIWENYIPKFHTSTFTVSNLSRSSGYRPGDTLEFTFTLNNSGPVKGTSPQVRIVLPSSGVSYVVGSTTRDRATISPDPISGKTITVSTNDVSYNDSIQITFQATIDSGASGNITIDPTVTSDEDTSGTTISAITINVTPGTSTSGSSSGSSSPGCSDSKPSHAPDLFQIDTSKTQATLYFTPSGKPYLYYFISYATFPSAEQHGVQFNKNNWDGVTSFTINSLSPHTSYYFKVRGGNGCMPGGWSNIMKATTTKYVKDSVKYYRYGKINQSQVEVSTGPELQLTSTPTPILTPTAPVSPTKPNVRKKTCILWNLICW